MTHTKEEVALIAGSFAVASPIPLIQMGARLRYSGGDLGKGEFIYLKGATGTIAGSVVTYNPKTYLSRLLLTDDIGPVAVACSAVGAKRYGWYRITGTAFVRAGTMVREGDVFASSIPGLVDGTAALGARVNNAQFLTRAGTLRRGFAQCEIRWPYMI